MFNALKYIRSLEGVGFPREQAEAQVQLVMDSFQENVATKSDVAELRSDLKSEMADFRAEMKTEMAAFQAEIAKFKAALAEMKTDLVFRLGGLIVLCTGILGFLIKS